MADSKLSALPSASLPLPGNAKFYVVVGATSYQTTLADILDNAGDYIPRVDLHADLPVTLGDPAVDALYLVRTSSGVWPVNRKPKGIWRRIANTGSLATDWEYWGDEQALADLFGSYQPLDSDLTAIAALAPSNDDVIQRKGGVWTNRTMAQLKADLVLTKSDVGLGNVPNVDATKRRIVFVFDGDGAVLTAGPTAYIRVPAGTITKVSVAEVSDTPITGSVQIELWKDSHANYPPTSADKISASAPASLSSAKMSEDSTLTGWSKTLNEGDWLAASVIGTPASVKRVEVVVEMTLS